MLRKRARSSQKNQEEMGQITPDCGSKTTNLQPDNLGQKQKTSSLYNIPGLLVGMAPKSFLDCDAVRSPTSPLDFKLFPTLGSSFRFPKLSLDSHQKCWECDKVGLSIVDSLDHGDKGDDYGVKTMNSSNSKNILFGPQVRIKILNDPSHLKVCELPKSLPRNCPVVSTPTPIKSSHLQKGKSEVLFEIGEDTLEPDSHSKVQSFSLDSKRMGSYFLRFPEHRTCPGTKSFCLATGPVELNLDLKNLSGSKLDSIDALTTTVSSNRLLGSLSATEIELSEDYTCVITHGPNPKTTHIFGDCVLEGHTSSRTDFGNKGEEVVESNGVPIEQNPLEFFLGFPENDFFSFCYFCNKKLEEGKDIYMYRGETFCSSDCRLEEILIEEGKEKSIKETPGVSPK